MFYLFFSDRFLLYGEKIIEWIKSVKELMNECEIKVELMYYKWCINCWENEGILIIFWID